MRLTELFKEGVPFDFKDMQAIFDLLDETKLRE